MGIGKEFAAFVKFWEIFAVFVKFGLEFSGLVIFEHIFLHFSNLSNIFCIFQI
jgi:hypothetical protein